MAATLDGIEGTEAVFGIQMAQDAGQARDRDRADHRHRPGGRMVNLTTMCIHEPRSRPREQVALPLLDAARCERGAAV
jgi:hypothetical protein